VRGFRKRNELGVGAMEFLKNEIESQLAELMDNGFIAECRELNETMPLKEEQYVLDDTAMPMHFTGNLNSKIVFIELNPGRGNLHPQKGKDSLILKDFGIDPSPVISDVKSYLKFFENFGYYKVESHKLTNKAISKFDNKQLNFFSGFSLSPIEKKEYSSDDVVRVRNEKLQLEIVPYVSRRFTFKNFHDDYICKRIKRIQSIISSHKREYVFVTGSDKSISKYFGGVVLESYSLPNKKSNVYIGVKLIDGVKYCFIKTYKAQGFDGMLMQEYGRLCRKLLDMCEIIQAQHAT
jgi:hypothetical protein